MQELGKENPALLEAINANQQVRAYTLLACNDGIQHVGIRASTNVAASHVFQEFLAMINEPIQEGDMAALLQQMAGQMGGEGGKSPHA